MNKTSLLIALSLTCWSLMLERCNACTAYPTAVISSPSYGIKVPVGTTVTCDGSYSYDNDENGQYITSWSWSIGSYGYSGSTINHTFDTAGTYCIYLRVYDDEGWSNLTSCTIYVVEVDSITEWLSEAEVIFVPVGEEAFLQANPNPDVSWPSGEPTWSLAFIPIPDGFETSASIEPYSGGSAVLLDIDAAGLYVPMAQCGTADSGSSISVLAFKVNITEPQNHLGSAAIGDPLSLACAPTIDISGSYAWTVNPDTGATVQADSADPSHATFTASQAGTYTVTVAYSKDYDGLGIATATDECQIAAEVLSVSITTPPPEAFPKYVAVDNPLTFQCQTTGAGEGNIAWSSQTYASFVNVDSDGHTVNFSASEPGEYTAMVQYTEGNDSVSATSGTIRAFDIRITSPSASTIHVGINEEVHLASETRGASGGDPYWDCSTPAYLEANGATATFESPESGTYTVSVHYTIGGATAYSETKTIVVAPSVRITTPSVSTYEASIDEEVSFVCQTSPTTGGTVTWWCGTQTYIEGTGRTATFSAPQAGNYWVRARFELGSATVYSAYKYVHVNSPSVEITNPSTSPRYIEQDNGIYLNAEERYTSGGTFSWTANAPGTWSYEAPADEEHPLFRPSQLGTCVVTATYSPPTPALTDSRTLRVFDVEVTRLTGPDGQSGQSISMELGDRGELECTWEGWDGGTYAWVQGNSPTGPGTLAFTSAQSPITQFSVDQVGNYFARAHYYLDTTDASDNSGWIHVTSPFVTMRNPTAAISVELGDVLDLTCDPSSPHYVGTFLWSKVNGPGTVGFPAAATSTLEDTAFAASQPGDYQVKVEYTKGGVTDTKVSPVITVTSLSVDLEVTSPQGFAADADYGDPIGLTCTPSGSGGTITWSATPSDGVAWTPSDPTGQTNVVFSATPTSVTEYTITVTYAKQNAVVSTSTSDSLTVTVNPCAVGITAPSDSPAFVCKGDPLDITCQVSGTQGGTVAWSATPSENVTMTPDGSDPFAATFVATQCGEYVLTVDYSVQGITVHGDPVTIVVWEANIDVDSNRNGIVEPNDNDVEEATPAVVPVNCDDDNDDDGRDCNNVTVDGATDMEDLVPVVIRRADAAGWTITLTTDGQHPFKVFRWGVDSHNIGEPDWDEMVLISSPHAIENTGGVDEITRLRSEEGLTYYIEADRFPLDINEAHTLTLTAEKSGYPTKTDIVKVRPSPFILPFATCDVSELFVVDRGDPNDDDFVAGLKKLAGTVTDVPSSSTGGDFWIQDEMEIGFTSWPAPGGEARVMHVVWNLGRNRGLHTWVRGLLGHDMGHFDDPAGDTFTMGGDIEVIPSGGSTGRGVVIVGSGSAPIRDFIAAQGVQTIVDTYGEPNIVLTDTRWLQVGHIDEVVSFLGGSSVAVADCNAALTILNGMNKECTSTGMGGANVLTNSGVTANTTDFKSGSASGDFESSEGDCMYIPDSSLSSNFPLKNGDTNKKISVTAWVKLESLPSTNSVNLICAKHNENTASKMSLELLAYNQSGTTRFVVGHGYNGGASEEILRWTAASPVVNRWYFVAYTYQDSDRSYRFQVWDDTNNQRLGGATSDLTGYRANNINIEDAGWYIGGREGISFLRWDGLIDHVVVFNRVLTSDEIDQVRQQSYAFGSDPHCVAMWDFEGTTLGTDSKGDMLFVTDGIVQYGGANLDPNNWVGGFIEITEGTAMGQVRQIAGIDHDTGLNCTTITVTRAWDEGYQPGSGSDCNLVARSAYRAMFATGNEECGVATGGDSEHLYDSTKSWNGEYDVDPSYSSHIMIVEGTGLSQVRRIASSQGQTITLESGSSWSPVPTVDSRYVIVRRSKLYAYAWPPLSDGLTGYMHDFTVVRYFLQDTAMIDYQVSCQGSDVPYQETGINAIKKEIDSELNPASFTLVPVVYKGIGLSGTQGQARSWLPDMVNLLNRSGSWVIPEPHVSENETFNNAFKGWSGEQKDYLDDWYFYHVNSGEIHCGTNATRTPDNMLKEWWSPNPGE